MSQPTRFDLTQADIPSAWYNLNADFPEPLPPPLHPGTKPPLPPEALEAIFPKNLIAQEISAAPWIEIPEPVREIYALWRPTPLLRAVRLEKALNTPAHIYYKYEGVSPAGSHKVNTSVAQAYYNKIAGTKRLATETGAGQWGASLAFACSLFGLECNVYMVKVSYEHKPYRRMLMHTWARRSTPARAISPNTAASCSRKIRIVRAALASPSAKPSRTPSKRRTPNTRLAACSITFAITRPSSARKRSSRWKKPARSRT
jgi:tryptophan synthase beta chain